MKKVFDNEEKEFFCHIISVRLHDEDSDDQDKVFFYITHQQVLGEKAYLISITSINDTYYRIVFVPTLSRMSMHFEAGQLEDKKEKVNKHRLLPFWSPVSSSSFYFILILFYAN